MSNRLGRNPLKTPKPAQKSVKKKAEQFGEIATEKTETLISASDLVQECMTEQLEKEQLERAELKRARLEKKQTPQAALPKTPLERLAHWLLVDLPAEGYVFGLKSILLIKTVWD